MKILDGDDAVGCLLVGDTHSSSHPLVKLTLDSQRSIFRLLTPTQTLTLIQMQMQTEKAMRTWMQN
jgi:hypothetical protein